MLGMTIPLLINSLSSKAQQQNCRWEEYGYYTKINGKWELVWAYKCVPIQTTSSNNSNLYKQKKKQYNWVKPNKYDNWQCAYELTYDSNTNTPDGFKLYVDDNGDNKPDYQYKYDLANVGHYYTGIDFDFKLDYYDTVVGDSSIEDNAVKALNTCGLQAIRQFIYYETDHDNPANYIVDKVDFNNYHYPYVSFYEK